MHYELIGKENEKTIVFLHGWGADSSIFRGVISFLPKKNWRYLLVDFPGFGKSSEPERDYNVEDYAKEVVKLLKELNIDKAIFIGHSFGGRVAVSLASRYAFYVQKLILVDSAGLIMNRGVAYKLRVWRYKLKKKMIQRGIVKGSLESFGSEDYRALKSDIMRKTFINVVNEDLLDNAKRVEAETILIWGKDDNATPIKMAKKFNRAIAGSKLFIIEEAGHYCFLDKTEDFVYILYDNIFI